MGNFVTGSVPLPPYKIDATPPQGNPAELDAGDINFLRDAVGDLRDHTAGWANVKAYGAKGDNATDDTAAFALAIAAAGKAVFVPPGTYLVKNLTISTAVRIDGAGRSIATLKLPVLAALDGSPILNITAAGVSVRHLGFDGQKSLQPADGFSDSFNGGANGQGRAYRALIRAYNPGSEIAGLVVEDCSLVNAYGAGIAAQNVSHAKIRRNLGNNNNFETIELYSTTAAGGATYYAGSEVTDNEITNTGSGDASINGNAIVLNHATEFIVAHNFTQTTERNGLKCEGCKNGVVKGNTFDNTTLPSFGPLQLQQDASNIVVEGNLLTTGGYGINNGFVAGSLGFSNISIINNVFSGISNGATPDGIAFTCPASPVSSGIVIAHNVMTGITRNGINISGGAWADITIDANNIKTVSGVGSQTGITVKADTAGNVGLIVTNNLCDLTGATSTAAGITFAQSAGQTIARATITGNLVINASRTTITDGNVALFTSGVFGGNSSDGFIRMGSVALQSIAPNAGGFTAQFQFGGTMLTAVTFANLGTPANGTVLYCSDATSPSSPATGGGTGALVVRQAGIWKAL